MTCPLDPMGKTIVMLPHVPESTKQGIVLPEQARDQRKFFEIIAVGPDCEHLKVGDKVLPPLMAMALKGIEWEGEMYALTEEIAIPCKIK